MDCSLISDSLNTFPLNVPTPVAPVGLAESFTPGGILSLFLSLSVASATILTFTELVAGSIVLAISFFIPVVGSMVGSFFFSISNMSLNISPKPF